MKKDPVPVEVRDLFCLLIGRSGGGQLPPGSRRPAVGAVPGPVHEFGARAEAAGVQAGDRVLAVDDTAVSDSSALKNYLKDKAIGDSVNLQVERNGKVQTLTVTLGSNQ